MTQEEARTIAQRFQNENLRHRSGHYHYGYTTLSYNHEKQIFELKYEDHAMNMYEPTVSYSHKTTAEFVAYLLKYHKVSDFDTPS